MKYKQIMCLCLQAALNCNKCPIRKIGSILNARPSDPEIPKIREAQRLTRHLLEEVALTQLSDFCPDSKSHRTFKT